MVALETRWHAPTNTRGSRISCRRMDADAEMRSQKNPDRVTISAPDELSGEEQHFAAVQAFCARYDWHGPLICGGTNTGYVWVFAPKSTPVSTDRSDYPRVWGV